MESVRKAGRPFGASAGWAIYQFARAWNLTTADGSNLSGRNGHNRSRHSGQCHKLHLVSFALGVDMNNGADIARFKPFLAENLGQNHSVVLANHGGSILDRMRCDRSRFLCSRIHDPDRPNRWRTPIRTAQNAVDPILCPVLRRMLDETAWLWAWLRSASAKSQRSSLNPNAKTQPRRADDVHRDSGTECTIRRWLQ